MLKLICVFIFKNKIFYDELNINFDEIWFCQDIFGFVLKEFVLIKFDFVV